MRDVQIMAHRGASKAERENTLLAFTRAVAMGANCAELDVRLCGSGELVVHHNASLDDGRVIKDIALGELPAHIPTLGDALDACAPMTVNIEIKNAEADPDFDPLDRVAEMVVRLLRGRGDPQQWLISAFRRETADRVHQLWPQLPTAWLTVIVAEADAARLAASLAASGHSALHPYVETLTRSVVEAMHAKGLAVNTWTCDDPLRMRELIEWGIDGICTNVPDVALEVLAETRPR